MHEYALSIVVHSAPLSKEQILDAAVALRHAGCPDATICEHSNGVQIGFLREAGSLQEALAGAVEDVEEAGFDVARVEIDKDTARGHSVTVREVVLAFEYLSSEEQEDVFKTIRARKAMGRRVQEAREAYARGETRRGTIEDLMREVDS